MAVIKAVSSRASIATALRYVTKTEKTERKLISGMDCSPDSVIDEMKMTKELWGKTGGRQYKHYVQSFPPDENITPEQAHEIAAALCAERFKGFEVLIATHKDRDHIHSHFIVNSVNYENGRKIQESAKDLQAMKDFSDSLCRERGFSICEKNDEVTAYTKSKYKTLEKAVKGEYKSYLLDCYKAVMKASNEAISREDFIRIMLESGYETNWSDTRKYITFTDGDGHKIRNSNLEKTFKEKLSKEDLENAYKANFERTSGTAENSITTGGREYAEYANGYAATGTAPFMGADYNLESGGQAGGGGQISFDPAVRNSGAALRDIERFYDRYTKRVKADERTADEAVKSATRIQKRSRGGSR